MVSHSTKSYKSGSPYSSSGIIIFVHFSTGLTGYRTVHQKNTLFCTKVTRDTYNTLHVHTGSDGLVYTLHVHTESDGLGYTLHVHSAGSGKYTPCTSRLRNWRPASGAMRPYKEESSYCLTWQVPQVVRSSSVLAGTAASPELFLVPRSVTEWRTSN
jgi:hypothetical protein